jgi:hypothetical protein
MASIRTPLEALTYAKLFVGGSVIDNADVKIRILQNASDRLWMFAPWRFSIGELDQVALVEDQQDYTITDPGDVMYPVRAEVRKSGQRNQSDTLRVVHNLASQTSMKGPFRDVGLTSATNLRLRPVPSGLESGDLGILFTWYKKENIEIVETGAGAGQANDDNAAALLFDDEWFWVYQELVLYYSLFFIGDTRAGAVRLDVQETRTATSYSGHLAQAMDALQQMARKEVVFLDDGGFGVNG